MACVLVLGAECVNSAVERLCDRVGIIIDGRMIACGTLDEVCGGMTLEDRFFEMYK